jgi:hypothetical protein
MRGISWLAKHLLAFQWPCSLEFREQASLHGFLITTQYSKLISCVPQLPVIPRSNPAIYTLVKMMHAITSSLKSLHYQSQTEVMARLQKYNVTNMAACVCWTRRTRHEDSSTTYIAPRPELLRHKQNSVLVNTKTLSSLLRTRKKNTIDRVNQYT